jgi:hypothetical protein
MSTTTASLVDAPPAAALTAPTALAREVALAFAGYAALGLCAGLGSGEAHVALRATPSILVGGVAALLLSTPALVVVHQFLRLDARPDALVGVVARAFASGGRVALGVVPVMLFASATTSVAGVVLAFLLTGIGAVVAVHLLLELVAVEPATDPLAAARVRLLALGWTALTGLVALRVAWDVVTFVLVP